MTSRGASLHVPSKRRFGVLHEPCETVLPTELDHVGRGLAEACRLRRDRRSGRGDVDGVSEARGAALMHSSIEPQLACKTEGLDLEKGGFGLSCQIGGLHERAPSELR